MFSSREMLKDLAAFTVYFHDNSVDANLLHSAS